MPTRRSERVPEAVLRKHGLKSLGEAVTPAKLREVADACRAAADDAEGVSHADAS
jgi:hypothetical protein